MRSSTKPEGLLGTLRTLVKQGGVRSLWNGNGANVLQVGPEMALNFFLYEAIKKQILDDPTKPSPLEKFSCGSIAGAIASTVVYPVNSVGAILAVSEKGTYSGLLDCFRRTWIQGGVRPFYKGYSANLPRIVISRGGDMLIFNELAERLVPEGEAISPIQGLVFGGLSSAIMTSATFPLLLARTKMQTQGSAGIPVLYTNFVDAMKKTYAGDTKLGIPRGGALALFNGLPAALMKFVPATSIQFMVYTQVLALLNH